MNRIYGSVAKSLLPFLMGAAPAPSKRRRECACPDPITSETESQKLIAGRQFSEPGLVSQSLLGRVELHVRGPSPRPSFPRVVVLSMARVCFGCPHVDDKGIMRRRR